MKNSFYEKMVVSMKEPVFIIGNPRSGTTLLRVMLNNHENIIIPPECGFLVWWYEKYKDWSVHSGRTANLVKEFVRDLSNSRKMETWLLDYADLTKFILSREPSSYCELASLVYIFWGICSNRSKDFSRWGDKNNYYISHLETIYQLFPCTTFIYLIRDGRDVACSYKNLERLNIFSEYKPKLPQQIEEIAQQWMVNNSSAISFFNRLDWKNVCVTRYEDLVHNSKTELNKICDFLGEPFDVKMLDYYQKGLSGLQEPPDFLQWKQKILERPTDSEIGKYKKQLSKNEIGKFNSIAGQLLERFRYL